jgi:hypothetical protein
MSLSQCIASIMSVLLRSEADAAQQKRLPGKSYLRMALQGQRVTNSK